MDTERLNRYWAEGPGAAKIRWGVPGDFDRCRVEMRKVGVPGHMIDGSSACGHADYVSKWAFYCAEMALGLGHWRSKP